MRDWGGFFGRKVGMRNWAGGRGGGKTDESKSGG